MIVINGVLYLFYISVIGKPEHFSKVYNKYINIPTAYVFYRYLSLQAIDRLGLRVENPEVSLFMNKS